jgi:hypothetical protein
VREVREVRERLRLRALLYLPWRIRIPPTYICIYIIYIYIYMHIYREREGERERERERGRG